MPLIDLANPSRFLALAERLLPWLAAAAGRYGAGVHVAVSDALSAMRNEILRRRVRTLRLLWCVPCHDEAPFLERLGADRRIRVLGINYKDQPDNARRFLGRYGNPFPPPAPTRTAAPPSSGASTGCRRPS
jgi:thiol-disulfide isomerase/thioredoxin